MFIDKYSIIIYNTVGDFMNEIEKSIIKKFKKSIWVKFVKAIQDFKLIEEGDKIAVCISGGKDSMLMAKCFQELQKHKLFHFDLEFISMNPGFTKGAEQMLEQNAKLLDIPLQIFHSDVFDVVEKHGGNSPCYLCARMRRGHLYNKAKELGCNKIALAHHMDDVIETVLMNMFYNGRFSSMLPKLKSQNFEGMELIRPFYYVKEEAIQHFVTYNNLEFSDCGCPLQVTKNDSKRKEGKELIKKLKETNENVDINILRSTENVMLDTLLGYQKDNEKSNFMEEIE